MKFCIFKKLMQRQINRVDKVVWEMLKHTHIIEQHELEEQNEKQDFDKKRFFTHLQRVRPRSSL
jgi:hypothetical protein